MADIDGTRIDEIADGIYRVNTPVPLPDGESFSFNQYLVVDDEPLLFHAGMRRLFPAVSAAIAAVMPVARLRFIAFSHFEADECGALNDFLAAAPRAVPVCSRIGAMVAIADTAAREPRVLADGERLALGHHELTWLDAPHVPHGWDSGLMMETRTRTFFCGDLFTQGGRGDVALTESDILGPSEAFRQPLDYYAHAPDTGQHLERFAGFGPRTLACMHGSAWHGDGAKLLRELGRVLTG